MHSNNTQKNNLSEKKNENSKKNQSEEKSSKLQKLLSLPDVFLWRDLSANKELPLEIEEGGKKYLFTDDRKCHLLPRGCTKFTSRMLGKIF